MRIAKRAFIKLLLFCFMPVLFQFSGLKHPSVLALFKNSTNKREKNLKSSPQPPIEKCLHLILRQNHFCVTDSESE